VFVHWNVNYANGQLSYLPPQEKRLLPFHTSTGDAFAESVEEFV
jgi:hypothetical protein